MRVWVAHEPRAVISERRMRGDCCSARHVVSLTVSAPKRSIVSACTCARVGDALRVGPAWDRVNFRHEEELTLNDEFSFQSLNSNIRFTVVG